MINKLILSLIVLFIGLQSQTQSISEKYDLRPLDEINLGDESDAYPWISDDGLRLYFCGNESGHDKSTIYIASRSNCNESFGEPAAVPINFHNTDNYSPYLSQDELTMMFAARIPDGIINTSVYLASRKTTLKPFGNVQKINLKGNVRGDLISPSFTQDLKELYLFNEYRNHQAILKFVQTGKYSYHLVNRYVLGKGYNIKSGKLSSDGLKLYMSLTKPASLPSIHIMTRMSLDTDFNEMKRLDHDILNHSDFRNHQPYFNSDFSFIVFARSDQNEWSRNNLFIAQSIREFTENKNSVIDIRVYPNPTPGMIKIESSFDLSDYEIEVFSLTGRKVFRSNLIGNSTAFDLEKLNSGSYLMRIFNENRKLISTKQIQLIDP